jgi:hypothetical protein
MPPRSPHDALHPTCSSRSGSAVSVALCGLLAVLLAGPLSACQAQGQTAPAAVAAAQVQAPSAPTAAEAATGSAPAADAEARLIEQLRSEIGAAPCSRDAQCHTLAVGSKPCGGPAAWWPWSVANARAERLQAWGVELERLQREHHERIGLLSNCRYMPDPGAVCVAQVCVLRSRPNGAV